MRVRFAPSPTGQVHIGNIRVAIFNWLLARRHEGQFLLRVEDTDLERSTPEAIAKLLDAMVWLGLDHDEEPVYQSKRRAVHDEAVRAILAAGHGETLPEGPTYLRIHTGLFDPSFVTEPREEAEIDLSKGELTADLRGIIHTTRSEKSDQTFTRQILWDALAELRFVLEDGAEVNFSTMNTMSVRGSTPLAAIVGGRVVKLRFRRRYVYFEDAVLGRLEKPLDSLRDMVIVRTDGSPIFHLANVVDDRDQGVTHVVRGNDHVENTYRHLFLYQALGATPPTFAHLPMIVNEKGKPYSKRDGDAYVGDFRAKGVLPECLFNFLALCGWAPGDNREVMTRAEMVAAFSLDRINDAPAQLNLEKLYWMNGQYLTRMTPEALLPLVQEELRAAGVDGVDAIELPWLARLIELEQERMRSVKEFVANTRYFFGETVALQEKAVKKVLQKNEGSGLATLRAMRPMLAEVEPWDEPTLEAAITAFAEGKALKMGAVAQPLRVACTGGTVSPGIWETLTLLGKDRTLRRIDDALAKVTLA